MDCEQLEAAMNAAYAAWVVDPSPANFAALQAAQGAWAAAGCNNSTGGGGNGAGGGGPIGGGLG